MPRGPFSITKLLINARTSSARSDYSLHLLQTISSQMTSSKDSQTASRSRTVENIVLHADIQRARVRDSVGHSAFIPPYDPEDDYDFDVVDSSHLNMKTCNLEIQRNALQIQSTLNGLPERLAASADKNIIKQLHQALPPIVRYSQLSSQTFRTIQHATSLNLSHLNELNIIVKRDTERIEELETENIRLNEGLQAAQTMERKLSELGVQDYRERVLADSKALPQVKAQFAVLEDKLSTTTKIMDLLRNKYDILTEETSQLRSTLATVKKEKEQLEEDRTQWEAERVRIESAHEQAELAKERDVELIRENVSLQRSIDELELSFQQVNLHPSDRDRDEATIRRLTASLDDANRQIHEWKSLEGRWAADRDQILHELEIRNRAYADSRGEVRDLQTQVEDRENDVDQLRQALRHADKAAMTRAHAHYSQEIQQLRHDKESQDRTMQALIAKHNSQAKPFGVHRDMASTQSQPGRVTPVVGQSHYLSKVTPGSRTTSDTRSRLPGTSHQQTQKRSLRTQSEASTPATGHHHRKHVEKRLRSNIERTPDLSGENLLGRVISPLTHPDIPNGSWNSQGPRMSSGDPPQVPSVLRNGWVCDWFKNDIVKKWAPVVLWIPSAEAIAKSAKHPDLAQPILNGLPDSVFTMLRKCLKDAKGIRDKSPSVNRARFISCVVGQVIKKKTTPPAKNPQGPSHRCMRCRDEGRSCFFFIQENFALLLRAQPVVDDERNVGIEFQSLAPGETETEGARQGRWLQSLPTTPPTSDADMPQGSANMTWSLIPRPKRL